MVRQLELSQGVHALVSDEDFEWASQFKWSVTRCSKRGRVPKLYARRSVRRGKMPQQTIYLHREIARRKFGDVPEGLVVDHCPDKDGLNCQRENLVLKTHLENVEHCLFKPVPKEEPFL